jgi:hypothetical protein
VVQEHLVGVLTTCGIMPNDVKIRVLPNNERMRG